MWPHRSMLLCIVSRILIYFAKSLEENYSESDAIIALSGNEKEIIKRIDQKKITLQT